MSSKLQNWLLVVLITLIWGSSFILMKRGLVAFSPTQVAAARLFIAALVTIPLFFRYVFIYCSANAPQQLYIGHTKQHNTLVYFVVGYYGFWRIV